MNKTMIAMKRAELDAILKDEDADLQRRMLREPDVLLARETRRLQLERELAAAAGTDYAEEVPLDHVIGYEWHIIANNAGSVVVVCGDGNGETSMLFQFNSVEKFRVDFPSNESGVCSYDGKGLGTYGLYVIQNSPWRRDALATASRELFSYDEVWWSAFRHFVLRDKGADLSCLARGYECRLVSEGIESIRDRAAFWEKLV